MKDRLSTLACTASIGPGSTNMLTGAALATVNRLPVLLLPSDIFATRAASPVLQELEDPSGYDVSVNDAFRPLSTFFDRVWRPEQLPAALLGAMRALTDPAQTGAVTVCLPQDVQAQAHDWPVELFEERVWHVARPVPGARPRSSAPSTCSARRSGRSSSPAAASSTRARPTRCAPSPRPPGSRWPRRRRARARCPTTPRSRWAPIGSTGTTAANTVAARGRRRHRHRHALVGLHHRLADRLPGARACASSTST